MLISKYIKEKYVLDKILEEQENWIKKFGFGRFTTGEIDFSRKYFNDHVVSKINMFNVKNSGTPNIIDINNINIK